MALSISGAPVYGGGTLDIEFAEDTPLNADRRYFVVYEGSKQRHITTAKVITSSQLHSVIPGHNEAEEVHLNVVDFHEEKSTILVSATFQFNTDGVFYLSQFLVESVFCSESLDDLELIKSDNFNLADEELSTLDKRLSRALTYCTFPEWWSLLGSDSQNENPVPRETLLHFSARLGLNRVASFFLRKPGSEQCLKLQNKNGQVPKDVALEKGYDGLAELLSEYNIHSLAPLGHWLVTDEGVVHSQETGDVTLTCNIKTHHRSLEEDIIVLQGVQKQVENDDIDISRQWQTDWPSQHKTSNVTVNSDATDEDKYKSICEKVQELPNVLTLETINDYRDSNGTSNDPNSDNAHTSDHVDISEDCDVAMDTESSPRLHVSEGEEEDDGIMEGTLSALRGYNEHLLRIRQKSTVFNKILEQELRKENLARFSSSCPSLDADLRNSPLPVIDEADLCKSMVDLVEDNGGETATTPSSLYTGDVFSSGTDITDSTDNIHIVVDGATTESSSDFGLQTQEYDQFLNEYYGGNVPQVRHRSPVPTKQNGVEDQDSESSMLIHGNKSVNLTRGDDEAVDNTLCIDDGGEDGGSEGSRRVVRSTGDMEQEIKEEEGIPKNSVLGSGRGQANKARYSADIEHMMRNLKGHHSGSSLDKMSASTHSTSSGTDSDTMGMPHSKITKAFSMSSIPAATNNEKHKGSYKDKQTPSHLLIQNLIAEHDALFRRQDEIQEEDPSDVHFENKRNNQRNKPKTQLSLLDFLNDPSNFSNDPSSPKPKDKEDKKRKTSVFSRFHSSYRIKKNKDKEGKSKVSSHRFVSVSFSNATTCDVCHKPLTNKPALRCQICLVNVHEHSCKEHIPACDKFKPKNCKMTDQFYYNCLVPDAMVSKGTRDVDDTPPPRPPRPPRTYESRQNECFPQQTGESVHKSQVYQQQGPEVPPRSAGVGAPLHQRTQSEPVDLGSDLQWSPQWFQKSSHVSYPEPRDQFGYPPVRSPAWLREDYTQGDPPADSPQRSPAWHYSMNQLAYEFNSSRDNRDYANTLSPRWQDMETVYTYDKSNSHPGSTEPSPGVPQRLTRSNPSSAEPSPGLPKRSPHQSTGSAEPSPSLSQNLPRRNILDKAPSFDYPPASPLKHEYHQSQVPKQSSTESEVVAGNQDRNASTGVSNLRPSYSFKDNSTRAQSMYVGAATQPLPIQPEIQQDSIVMRKRRSALQSASAQLQRRSLPTPRIVIDSSHARDRPKSPNPIATISSPPEATIATTAKDARNNLFASPNTGTYLQWRRASAVSVDQAIAEEERESDTVSRLDLGQSNITEAISRSTESLDDVDSVQEVRYDDVELGSLDVAEPETWSETVDKKVLKKMNMKDVKRQDTIWELIQTERQYCKRLKTAQIFFRDGMLKELHMTRHWVDKIFPQLDELIHVHMNFYRQLQELQNKRQDRLVEEIGWTLKEQFSGESAERMKASYGVFCSGHHESVQIYKDLMEKKKFQMFIRARTQHPLCRKREIPDFILLMTQRPTKYPTLIEAVIKSTKDKKDRENLLKALELSKDVLQSVNAQVAKAERAMRLKDIFNRLDSRSFALHRGKKFRKMDILANNRVLLHEGVVGWKTARGKALEVVAVVLNDVLFFLQENNQKYSFFSLDSKDGVVSLFNLLVREKRDTRDTIGMYLISQNKQNPEMYEIVFNTTTEMQRWAQILRSAVENCPEEEEEVPTEAEEERRKMEIRQARAQAIMENLRQKDLEIKQCCDEKNRLMVDLMAVYNDNEESIQQVNSRPSSREFEESSVENASLLQAAIEEVSKAASELTTMLQGNGSSLSRSVSSVGEHTSNTYAAVPIPKRAETFGGFDNSHESNRVKVKGSDVPDYSCESDQGGLYKDHDISDPDLAQYSDLQPPVIGQKNYDSGSESGMGSSFYSSASGSKLSPMSNPSQDQSNIAHLLQTLNKIVHLTASQGTAVETLRVQLAAANERINKLSADVHEKKSGYRHSQLEELRNLQGVIQKEKEDWELKKTREKRDMEQERFQLEEMKRDLEKQEADLRQQKEELNKKREVLQRQMELLRQSGQLPKDTSFSDLASADPANNVQSKSDFVPGHRRSASAESFNSNGESTKTGPSATKENNFRENKSVTKLQSFSFGSKQSLPVHLLSATNEQKIGSKNVQQLPSKLLAGGSVSAASPQQTTHSGPKNSSIGISSQSQGSHSSQSLPQEYGIQSSGPDPSLGHSSSTGHIVNPGTNQGHTGAASGKNWQSNRPKQSSKPAGLSGVLKLAEKGDKKSKSSSSSSQLGDKSAQSSPPQSEKSSQQRPKSGTSDERNPNINHKPQKSDSDVIYF